MSTLQLSFHSEEDVRQQLDVSILEFVLMESVFLRLTLPIVELELLEIVSEVTNALSPLPLVERRVSGKVEVLVLSIQIVWVEIAVEIAFTPSIPM